VQLLHESLLDAFTTDTGEVDFGRKGGMSLSKQMKSLVSALNREVTVRGYVYIHIYIHIHIYIYMHICIYFYI
jgi:hypothetical protein